MTRLLTLLMTVCIATTALADTVYHASARVIPATGGRANEVFLFDSAGNLTGSYAQIAGARTDTWGYRDGASDGSQVYFGWLGGVARHNADGSGGVLLFDGTNAPGTYRALAFDPTGDGGAGSLWTANFASQLIEVDMAGNVLTTFANSGWSLFGLAFDDSDGNLWGHTSGGGIIRLSTATGAVLAGGWATGFTNLLAQGGLSGYSELGGDLAAISQGSPDELGVYDVGAANGSFVLGPMDLESLTGSNGHLGIAVTNGVPEPASFVLVGMGVLVLVRRRRKRNAA